MLCCADGAALSSHQWTGTWSSHDFTYSDENPEGLGFMGEIAKIESLVKSVELAHEFMEWQHKTTIKYSLRCRKEVVDLFEENQ